MDVSFYLFQSFDDIVHAQPSSLDFQCHPSAAPSLGSLAEPVAVGALRGGQRGRDDVGAEALASWRSRRLRFESGRWVHRPHSDRGQAGQQRLSSARGLFAPG